VLPPLRITRGSDAHLVDLVANGQEGNLNNILYWAACCAVDDGVMTDEFADRLVGAAVGAGHPERGARRTVESAQRRGRR
jgi:hypothetical protein